MRKSVVLTLTLALLLGLSASGAAAQEKPRYGGVLNWYVYADPGRLDIHAESPLSVQQALAGVYSSLLHYDPDDPTKITGDLAERWTVSPDGKAYTFHLRKGVKWHDGQPFSAADVKATFDRVLNPNFQSPRCGSMLKPLVASVEMLDPHTVQFQLKFPAAPFVSSVASAWCRVAAKHILEKYGDLTRPEAQIGTGPFKFKRYERDSVIEWEKNKDYFIPGLPYLDGVKQFVLKGVPTQVAAAKAGRIVLWDTWPPMKKTEADEVKRARGEEVEIYQSPLNTIMLVYMHTQKPPFNNPDLRKAVNLAIDRQELVAKTLEGAGVPCAMLDPKLVGDFALPLEEVNKLPGCRQPKDQDIAEAKRLVEKHYPNGVDVEAAVRSVGGYIDRAQLVLAQLRKIGIRGTLKTYESAAGFAVYGKGDFIFIAIQDRAMVTGDPSDVFGLIYTTGSGSNWGRWSDPKVDELADRGLKEQNREKRRQIYHELQRHLLTQDTTAVSVGWIEGWFFRDKRVRNYKVSPTIYDHNTFMKVWLAQ
ncbi:MAG: ABC transporter substrate-binding protein [Candidatus Rokubacteria bacterium]|nr:ABC transporter substrate-binding protein [Candidatus Rokubacteria bacterium]MBI2553088.1 ABC transporter substrate-binding protein [Candidatus Rokubacteria bacterium]